MLQPTKISVSLTTITVLFMGHHLAVNVSLTTMKYSTKVNVSLTTITSVFMDHHVPVIDEIFVFYLLKLKWLRKGELLPSQLKNLGVNDTPKYASKATKKGNKEIPHIPKEIKMVFRKYLRGKCFNGLLMSRYGSRCKYCGSPIRVG